MNDERRSNAPRFDLDWGKYIANSSRLCVFVGAGVSVGAKTAKGGHPPNWEGLIASLEIEFPADEHASVSDLGLRERAELVDQERKSRGISNREFLSHIESRVDTVDGDPVLSGEVHNIIEYVGPSLIVTTNYDSLIERHMNLPTEPGYNVWTYPGRVEQLTGTTSCREDSSLGDFLRSGEPLILKIHGGVETFAEGERAGTRDDSDYEVVFSDSSYYKAYGDSSEIPSLLRAIFSTHQVIFIGFSLRDQVLRDILQSVGALRGSRFRHVVLQSPDGVVPEVYKEVFQETYGLIVGTYSSHKKLGASLHSVTLSRD